MTRHTNEIATQYARSSHDCVDIAALCRAVYAQSLHSVIWWAGWAPSTNSPGTLCWALTHIHSTLVLLPDGLVGALNLPISIHLSSTVLGKRTGIC
jgi:hypothetical protein